MLENISGNKLNTLLWIIFVLSKRKEECLKEKSSFSKLVQQTGMAKVSHEDVSDFFPYTHAAMASMWNEV